MNLPVEVVEAISEQRCLLFVGGRFSTEAAEAQGRSLPAEKELAKELGWTRPRQRLGARARPPRATPSAGAAAFLERHNRADLLARLRTLTGAADVAPAEWHRQALTHFPLVFTTTRDDLLERAAAELGQAREVRHRGDEVDAPDADHPVLYRMDGVFSRPDAVILPGDPRPELPEEVKKSVRKLIRGHVVLFVGYRPDHEEFEQLWEDLTLCYGGELPRCHLAVAQGQIDDVLWQKWVWRGLLMFTADPSECMQEIARRMADA
ncbi:MAG: SIR2 family protein [Alphaproteobacteria bacterium]|nr:SIR2 family protein [Alphaproteobacteria bacterium]